MYKHIYGVNIPNVVLSLYVGASPQGAVSIFISLSPVASFSFCIAWCTDDAEGVVVEDTCYIGVV